jgi:drug/metabolite transporter (DMT)-like permease
VGLASTGVTVLVLSNRPSQRNRRFWAATAILLVAAACTAARIVWLRRRATLATKEQKIEAQNSILGAAACTYLLLQPSVAQRVPTVSVVLWIVYSIGTYVAYLSLFEGFESSDVTTTASDLLAELLLATVLGMVVMGEYADGRMVSVGGIHVPLLKFIGISLIVATILVS